MRVISGKYKGRNIDGFNIEGTRPTMDRVKESMFALIQNKVKESICLDLFAGSGSLGIEAISNGSKCTYFVDNNKKILDILTNNIKKINIIEEYHIIKDDYKNALNYFKNNNIKFDLIILDPPYKYNLINDVLDFIYNNNLLNDDGIILCEYEEEKVENLNLKLLKEKKYGSKYVKVYTN